MAQFMLPTYCSHADLVDLHTHLLSMSGENQIRIDGTQVVKVTQALLQLLLSARKNPGGALIDPSPALSDAATMCGLDAALFGDAAQ